MKKALGMIEFKTVASGITATDLMLKTADVEVVQASPVCPGKYLATIAGELSSVRAAIDAAEAFDSAKLVDKFVLGNPHESIFGAIKGANDMREPQALGILETFTAASAIVAADTTAKTADVDLLLYAVHRYLLLALVKVNIHVLPVVVQPLDADDVHIKIVTLADGTRLIDSVCVALSVQYTKLPKDGIPIGVHVGHRVVGKLVLRTLEVEGHALVLQK